MTEKNRGLALSLPAEQKRNGPGSCRQCGRVARVGWVTCGVSYCQEAEYHANAARSKGRRR
jgi:hypothetical protein